MMPYETHGIIPDPLSTNGGAHKTLSNTLHERTSWLRSWAVRAQNRTFWLLPTAKTRALAPLLYLLAESTPSFTLAYATERLCSVHNINFLLKK